MRVRAGLVVATGAVGIVALLFLALAGLPEALVPAVLPAAFLAAGFLGIRGRPDHRGVLLLGAVGSAHLAAFSIGGWLARADAEGPGAWLAAIVAHVLYVAGFVSLALLIAGYPDGRVPPWFWRIGVAVAGGVITASVLLAPNAPKVLEGPGSGSSIPAPAGLPLAAVDADLFPLMPLLVVVAVAVLAARFRRTARDERTRLSWALLAGALLALLLAATPAATAIVPEPVWTTVFLTTMSLVPFVLLGGLARHRLLDVDLLLTRTLARGAVLVVILSLYAALAGLAVSLALPLATGLTVVAALTGARVLRWGERWADRLFASGRVARTSLLQGLGHSLAVSGPDVLPAQIASALREAFDATWVRLVVGEVVVARSASATRSTSVGGQDEGLGDDVAVVDDAPAEVSVPLESAATRVGTVEAGRRRGGWSTVERRALSQAAPQVAAALHAWRLHQELAKRVAELSQSRARLVQAEEMTRRRMERDLHDGVQQQLVALLARIGLAREMTGEGAPASELLRSALELTSEALSDLRQLVSGIHPAVLTDRGLVAAVQARAATLPIDVHIDVDPRVASSRFGLAIESSAYFVVCEALTNVVKHSGSPTARVLLAPVEPSGLRVAIVDEGSGGATLAGTGLTGLRDRVEAVQGVLQLHTVPGVGTTVVAEFPGRGDAPTATGNRAVGSAPVALVARAAGHVVGEADG